MIIVKILLMRHLVEKKELMFGKKGAVARLRATLLMSLFGLNRLNRLYNRTYEGQGTGTGRLLKEIGAGYTAGEYDMRNIPARGPVIIVANHATGALDGVVLIDMLSKIRPDVKFMGNFLLTRVDYLRDYFISVDPFDSRDRSKNLRGLRLSMSHLQTGGALVIFPAGEVATWRKGFSHTGDKPWSNSVVRFIRAAGVPVVPVFIEASNSLMFHLLGKVNPVLRTAMLPHELMNKRGRMVIVNIGSPVTPRMTEELADMKVYGDYLRANVDYLTHKQPRRKLRIIPQRKPAPVVPDEITAARERELIAAELEAIRSGRMLFEQGGYEVFLAPSTDIPNMMHEIGRMREVTFREIGEGSMKSIDMDSYDAYYHQLFVWDRAKGELVGAYRMGMGRDIMASYGLKGFYTDSLFKYSGGMAPVMEQTIELGRSFITSPYQRKAVSLMLLWKGIIYVLLKFDDYRNLLGPVTISGDFQNASKVIIMEHLRQHHYNTKLAAMVEPVTGLEGISAPIDPSLIEGVDDMELINKIVRDIERGEFSVPVLIRKYLQLNSTVLGFNVDHDFNNALDALMLLDLKRVPEHTITMLSKEITEIDVLARFKKLY